MPEIPRAPQPGSPETRLAPSEKRVAPRGRARAGRAVGILVLFLALVATSPAAARELRQEIVLDVPVERAWELFTTEEGVERWMVPRAEIDFRLGGAFRTSYQPEVDLGGDEAIVNRILAYEPERMLALQNVQAPPGFENPELFQQTWEVIRFEPLEPEQGRERTRIVITGLGYGEGEEWDRLYAFFERGNASLLDKLREVVASASGSPETR